MPDELPAQVAPSPSPSPSPAPSPEPAAPSSEQKAPLNNFLQGLDLESSLAAQFKKEGVEIDDKGVQEPEADKVAPEPQKPVKTPSKAQGEPISKDPEKEPVKVVDPDTIQPNRALKGDDLKGWNALKTQSKANYQELLKARAKLKEQETVIASKTGTTSKEVDALKAQIAELQPFRQMVDMQHDPEFLKSFEQPIEAAKNKMTGLLKKLQVDDATIAKIDFFDVQKVALAAKTIEEAGDPITAKRLLGFAENLQELTEKRQEALDSSKTKFAEFKKTRETQLTTQKVEEEARMNRVLDSVKQADEKGNHEFPFLVEKEIPEGSKKETVELIAKHNEMAGNLQVRAKELATQAASNPEIRAQLAIGAIAGAVERQFLSSAYARITELEAEMKRVTNSGSEKKSSAPAPQPKSGQFQTADEALSNAFPGMK